MFEKLCKFNNDIRIYSVNDPEFLSYGKVLDGYDVSEVISECSKIEMPDTGSAYRLSIPELEGIEVTRKIINDCFGQMDIQVGLCWGHNKFLNALEYHKSSEINIAVTPFVLLLAKVYEMDGTRLDSKNVKGFFVDKGQVVEVYGTSMHFCPCEAGGEGFSSVVMLHKGTNDLLDAETKDPLLFKKNKWLICHEKNNALIERKAYPGLYGQNFEIKT